MADVNTTASSPTITPKSAEKAKKEKTSFSDEEVEALISHGEYYKKDARNTATQRILLGLNKEGLTIAELQKKMSCLRTYYGKEYGKEKASKVSGTGTKNVYVSKWPFYSSLQFLQDNITPRKTSSTMNNVEVEVDSVVDCQETTDSPNTTDENTVKPTFTTNSLPVSNKNKRKQLGLEDELMLTCIQELKKSKNSDENKEADTDASFGQYVVNQLHKIPDGYHKEMLKLQIQQLIIKVMIPTPAMNPGRQPFTTINFDDFQ